MPAGQYRTRARGRLFKHQAEIGGLGTVKTDSTLQTDGVLRVYEIFDSILFFVSAFFSSLEKLHRARDINSRGT
jgi:hypothetical protein